MRFRFNIAEPSIPDSNFMVPVVDCLPKVQRFVENKTFFVDRALSPQKT